MDSLEIKKDKDFIIRSPRQRKAFEYALDQLKTSPVYPFVRRIILYGSCARKEEKWDSDVDLFVEIDPLIKEDLPDYKTCLLSLRSLVNTPQILDPETDLHIELNNDWEDNGGLFYEFVKKEGIEIYSRREGS